MIQQVYMGFKSISNLKKILSRYNPKKIFLVTGKKSYEKSGAEDVLDIILKNYGVVHFSGFETNPKLSDIKYGVKLLKKKKCDFVIAVGGGSVIDMAKAVNIFVANPGKSIKDLERGKEKIKKKGNTLVAIPTTAGSGSEATKFAAIYVGKTKYSLEHDFILPDYAIVYPKFTMSLSKYQTASTGMDALGQAIESYWCINSNDESKKYAKESIKLVMKYLPDAVNRPSMKSREAMTRASHLAGKAINISKTTASHAISYPLTSYFNVPHGHAVALTLAPMLAYNSQVTEKDVLDKRGVNYVKNIIKAVVDLIGGESVEKASETITTLMKKVGLSTKLSELGIKSDRDIEIIIQNGFNPGRVKNNPRRLTEDALRMILEEII